MTTPMAVATAGQAVVVIAGLVVGAVAVKGRWWFAAGASAVLLLGSAVWVWAALTRPPGAGLLFWGMPTIQVLAALAYGVYVALRTRRTARLVSHRDGGCAGLPGGCPDCIDLYRGVVGDRVGLCMVCDGRHWPWEPHSSAGADVDGGGDGAGDRPAR